MLPRRFRLKKPQMKDNATVPHCAQSQRLPGHPGANLDVNHPPYSPDLAPCHLFLFPKMKKMLAGELLTPPPPETFKKRWDGVAAAALKEDTFTTAFQKRLERHRKCLRVGGTYVKKSS